MGQIHVGVLQEEIQATSKQWINNLDPRFIWRGNQSEMKEQVNISNKMLLIISQPNQHLQHMEVPSGSLSSEAKWSNGVAPFLNERSPYDFKSGSEEKYFAQIFLEGKVFFKDLDSFIFYAFHFHFSIHRSLSVLDCACGTPILKNLAPTQFLVSSWRHF